MLDVYTNLYIFDNQYGCLEHLSDAYSISTRKVLRKVGPKKRNVSNEMYIKRRKTSKWLDGLLRD